MLQVILLVRLACFVCCSSIPRRTSGTYLAQESVLASVWDFDRI